MFHPKRTVRHATSKVPENRPSKDDATRDDFAKLAGRADRAFKKAAKAAVAENDARGIPTHGAKRGKIVVRTPVKRAKAAIAG